MTAAPPRRFRFRPRFPGVAWVALVFGLGLLALVSLGRVDHRLAAICFACGAICVLAGGAYLRSPAWRLVVEVDDAGVRVARGRDLRVQLAWADVVALRVDREQATCVIDGGSAARRVLVPGPGLPAPYRIEDREALVALLVEHVPAERHAPLTPSTPSTPPAPPTPSPPPNPTAR